MTDRAIGTEIEEAYRRAVASTIRREFPRGGSSQLFDGLRLFGREAGADFAETLLPQIVAQARGWADARQPSMTLSPHGWGRAAIDGFVHALEDATGFTVELQKTSVVLKWA